MSGTGQLLWCKPRGGQDGLICAVPKIGDSPPGTAQSGGEFEEGRRPAPLGRAPATQAWVRGEGRALAARFVRVRGPSPRTKQREPMCSQDSALLSKSRSPGATRDAAPAGEPVPGTEAAVLWRPTRGKGEPASRRRQASEGRSGGPAYVTVISVSTTKNQMAALLSVFHEPQAQELAAQLGSAQPR
jgi:hypothetical protein